VVAQGSISDGRAGPGSIGGLSTAELIRKAREDDKIKAIVLRVDSPGGSAFGSELVRRELELTRKAGKPVVVSMGNLAASGGYWISMAADEIIADEASITGSIGVVGLLPTAQGAMDKLGIRTGGVTTTWLADAYDPKRALDPRFAQLVQSFVDGTYRDFTVLVAAARKSTPEKIDELAQGRVWSGKDAQARGLVDQLRRRRRVRNEAGQAGSRPAHRIRRSHTGPAAACAGASGCDAGRCGAAADRLARGAGEQRLAAAGGADLGAGPGLVGGCGRAAEAVCGGGALFVRVRLTGFTR
jgi:protease IV